MCLAIPMRVLSIDGLMARCEARGVVRDVPLVRLLGLEIHPGEHLAVHAGQAIARMTSEEARAAWALYDEMLARSDDDRFGSGPMV